MKVLMVCLGNICRSPLAQGILEHKIRLNNLDWIVDSAGTANYHTGEPPHVLSQKIAALNGINISDQQARQFVKEDMQRFDKIYVMDASNYNDVQRMSKSLWREDKTDLILNELFPGQNKNVPDPWNGTEKGYHEVFELLDKACDQIIAQHLN